MLGLLLLLLSAQAPLAGTAGEKALVLLFIRTDCPISNRYAPELKRLYAAYAPHGIAFRLIYPEHGIALLAIDRHRQEYGYSMPAFPDPDHQYVARAGVRTTPEAAVFVQGKLIYRGRVDDQFVSLSQARPQAAHHDLESALSAIAAGHTPAFRETRAIGCAIESVP